ncbi:MULTISPECIES: hypothetical protein [Undibacterium]|jgi:hypothetical protein|uniref:XRE family transcriptional regulator n=1 Tax=Undibacterium parvum TaxID=401471 RepID=A0A3Q9BRJ9_9BURK|nr:MULTISPECIES: hypothetical protein [Undibacterium]AZP12058.1 hypothetical protein EJN92_08625 [Undibacterium parvum]MCX7220753.1 hypothetical protein [Burkholderiales bacterium]
MANLLQITSADINYQPEQLLDALLKLLNLKNDAALSKRLDIAPPVISKIRNRLLPVGSTLLIRMHEVSEISIKDLRALMGDHRPRFFVG